MRRFIDIEYVMSSQLLVGDAILKDDGTLMYVAELRIHNGRVEALSSKNSFGGQSVLFFVSGQVVPIVPLES